MKTLAQTLTRARRKRRISTDKPGRQRDGPKTKKTPEIMRFWRYFRGPLVMVKKRGRRDSNPPPDCHNDDTGKHVTETPSEPLAHSLARESQKCPVEGLSTDADLAKVINAWPTLPDALRKGILAMVEATRT